ncbi:MAG TPA: universal stress protein [Thermodesulfovibrionales bacterium]|nr:universal stress protein [Thermodesulfovibrionales bacterium]
MTSKILLPLDGSETSQKAAEYAVSLAEQTKSSVTLLAVIDKGFFVSQSVPGRATPTHLVEPIEDYLRQAAAAFLEEAEALCKKKNVRSHTVIRSGHPVEEIMKEAVAAEADLIVMGSHGRSALKTAVIGSVTLGVIHGDAKTPVLVVKK